MLGCVCHSVLLVFGAPHKHRLLVGREHGRTIPLADIGLDNVPASVGAIWHSVRGHSCYRVGQSKFSAGSNATTRVHHPSRRRGGMAVYGTCAAARKGTADRRANLTESESRILGAW